MFTYKDAQAYVENAKKKGSVLGLDNMYALMNELGNPQNRIPTIHIAGTNGKGSVGAYLASICKEADFKVARYCTPAVFHPLECWQFDGNNITEEEYAENILVVKEASEKLGIEPTYFEIETAMAFVYFEKMQPDIFLLEVGMGGAMDATNVVEAPIATVFTKISYDHMQFLGESLKEIATEKAGIMKPGCLAFWGEQESEVAEVLRNVCKKVGAIRGDVYDRSVEFISRENGKLRFYYLGVEYETQMLGEYQMQNAALAIAVFDAIWPLLVLDVEDEMDMWNDKDASIVSWLDMEYASKVGVSKAIWPGRFEVISKEPLFIIDGAHNEDAAKQLAITIENSFTNPRINFIIGILADKEHEKMLTLMLPYANKVFTVTPPNPRGLDGDVLAEEVKNMHEDVLFCPSIEEAVSQALTQSEKDGCPILAFGSLSYLGELKEICLTEKRLKNV